MGIGAERELRTLERRGIRANPYRAGRSLTMSRHGIVATSHVLASQAGLDLLRTGGTAMDAAVAAAATLGVVEPMSVGLGGDVWLLYYEARTGRVHALNGSGRSPRRLSPDHFRRRAFKAVPVRSWEAVTVPGAVDAFAAALERFGRKSLAAVLTPAIRYAEEGFGVTEVVARTWKQHEKTLSVDPWARSLYLVDGSAPRAGEVFRQPRLGESLKLIAEAGPGAFYRGPIAEEIVRHARESGGFLTLEDFDQHRSEWVDPISVNYRGLEVCQCPPNGQGLGVLLMLNILEGFDLAALRLNSAPYLHLLIEAKKLAYADLGRYVGDPAAGSIPIQDFLSKPYAEARRRLIDPSRAAGRLEPGLRAGSDTVYLATVDAEGNAASFISSLFAGFGSGIVGGATGILLQNRGAGFTLKPGHPNAYAPGKRPYHTIIPAMVLRGGRLYAAFGVMGGPMQPQGQVQVLLAHLEHGLTMQEAIDLPRWRHMAGREVRLEHGMAHRTARGLAALGHRVRPAGGEEFGGAQAIVVDPGTGTYLGASDPRKDGAALGY